MRTLLFTCLLAFIVDVSAQGDGLNILNRDSFAPNVKKVTVDCYLRSSDRDSNEFQSSRYYECDSSGKWIVRIETYSDGDASHDTVKYDKKTRTRVIIRANDFEPSKTTTVFNKDGTVKSFLAEPAQRDPQLTEFEYDANKRVVKKTLTFVEFRTVEVYDYDELGRTISLKRSSGAVVAQKLQLDYEEWYSYSGTDAMIVYGFHYGANEQVRVRDTTMITFSERLQFTSKVEIMENASWEKVTNYTYDEQGRLIGENWTTRIKADSAERAGHRNMEYDSLGYYSFFIEEETSYSFSNRWIAQYNKFGLPEQCNYQTAAETFYYEWKYEYR